MVLLAGDAVPETSCKGPGFAIAGRGMSVSGCCACPVLGLVTAEVATQWQPASTRSFGTERLVSELRDAIQTSKVCPRTQSRGLAGSAHSRSGGGASPEHCLDVLLTILRRCL